MKLFLVRHGQALDAAQDEVKHLSEKGKAAARKIAGFLKKAEINVDTIISSPKSRALETADILAEYVLPEKKVITRPELLPNDSVENFIADIEFEEKDIILVGHLPFLSYLVSLLLSNDKNTVQIIFSCCCVACIEKTSQGIWRLLFVVNPEIL